MDLNVKYKLSSAKENSLLIKRSIEFGWKSVGWSQRINAKTGLKNPSVKPIGSGSKQNDFIHIAVNELRQLRSNLALLNKFDDNNREDVPNNVDMEMKQMIQYNRLTITVDDIAEAQLITHTNDYLRQFDIVAVIPTNGQVFNHLCKYGDMDIITFDFQNRIPFTMHKKVMDEAINRGIQFEIIYSHMLQSGSSRKEMLVSSKNLIRFLRGRNLILSSGAESLQHIRGPQDVINIGRLLNLTTQQAIDAITTNCEAVIAHGQARKNRFMSVEVSNFAKVQSILQTNQQNAENKKLKAKQIKRKSEAMENANNDSVQPTKKKSKLSSSTSQLFNYSVEENLTEDEDSDNDDENSNDDGDSKSSTRESLKNEKLSSLNDDFISF